MQNSVSQSPPEPVKPLMVGDTLPTGTGYTILIPDTHTAAGELELVVELGDRFGIFVGGIGRWGRPALMVPFLERHDFAEERARCQVPERVDSFLAAVRRIVAAADPLAQAQIEDRCSYRQCDRPAWLHAAAEHRRCYADLRDEEARINEREMWGERGRPW